MPTQQTGPVVKHFIALDMDMEDIYFELIHNL